MTTSRAAVSPPGYERLLPSVLLPPEDPTGTHARTARDWVIDVGVVIGAGGLGLFALLTTIDTALEPLSTTTVVVDVVLGTVAVLALLVRRRYPVAVGWLTILLTVLSATASFAAIVGLFTVAVHRRFGVIVPLAIAHLVEVNVYTALRPTESPWLLSFGITVAFTAIVVGYGMFVRARRQLIWTLEERALRAEAEQELLAEQARAAERARIAREMHDVLGHRISLLTLHAGGLQMRPDLPPAEVAATAELLRSTARQALDDLRAIIGILREDGSLDAPSSPQPTLVDVERLVEDTRRAGATVSLSVVVDASHPAERPLAAERVAYRVVQEALTNVAKHAPGAATIVDVTGGPDDGLVVAVRNFVGHDPLDRPLPGGGVGLIGLRERVELAGGTLTHGLDHRGEFVVEARLLWA